MHLEPRGLVREERVAGTVAAVEGIRRERFKQVEDTRRLCGINVVLHGPIHKRLTLLRHFLRLLLAHGSAKQVGFGKRIATQ